MTERVALWAMVILINVVGIEKGFSYSFTQDIQLGFYWGGFPINFKKVVVDASHGPMLQQLTDQAVNEWEFESGIDLWSVESGFEVTSNFQGNFIRWSFDFENETGFDGQSTLAVTTRYIQGTNIVRSDIILNGNNSALFNNQGNMLYATILHEFGHVMGLGHSDMLSIMQPSLTWLRSLQEDDIAGAIDVHGVQVSRQASGFVSPQAAGVTTRKEKDGISGCGTINMQGPGANGPGSMGGLFVLMLGLLLGLPLLGGQQRRSLAFSSSLVN